MPLYGTEQFFFQRILNQRCVFPLHSLFYFSIHHVIRVVANLQRHADEGVHLSFDRRKDAGSSRKAPVWLPILVLLIAMSSIQSGASLAKSLFPLVGAPGVTALRLALGTLILIAFFKPWRLRFAKEQRLPLLFYGLSLGGMNYLFYLSIQTVPLGIAVALEFTGPLAVALFSSRRPVDFIWVALAVLGLWFLLPLGQDVSHVDLTGAALALGAGACWAIYILTGQRAGAEHGPATVAVGSLIAALIFVPIGALGLGMPCGAGPFCR